MSSSTDLSAVLSATLRAQRGVLFALPATVYRYALHSHYTVLRLLQQ